MRKKNSISRHTKKKAELLVAQKKAREIDGTSSLNGDSTSGGATVSGESREQRLGREKYEKEEEEELMGESSRDPDGQRSRVMERNINQMVGVMTSRLENLARMAQMRIQYCEEDLDASSTKTSTDAPRVSDDMDVLEGPAKPSTTLFNSKATGGGVPNLISTNTSGVIIDPVRLVIKTKSMTEAGRKIDVKLEQEHDMTMTSSNRSNKKSSAGANASTMRNKKSEAQRHESKRQLRLRLEKELQAHIDTYVTRSVMDKDIIYSVPHPHEPPGMEEWPIPVKWSSRPRDRSGRHDIRAERPGNERGIMQPYILLMYAIGRMTVPGLFPRRWVTRQVVTNQLLVYFFWYIKVKFFQKDMSVAAEEHLIALLSAEHVKLLDAMSVKAHDEHEKDTVYQYLPYVLAHAVCFAFNFLCPGSRHLYTKPFKRTVLLQVINVLHGVQLCPVSVRVQWGKVFTDDIVDDEDGDHAHDLDSMPHPIALPSLADSPDRHSSARRTGQPRLLIPLEVQHLSTKTRKSGVLEGEDVKDDTTKGLPFPSPSGLLQKLDAMETKSTSAGGSVLNEADNKRDTEDKYSDTSDFGPEIDVFNDPFYLTKIINHPMNRATLAPQQERPKATVVRRQPVASLDAQSVSPLMQHFLGATSGNVGTCVQTLSRTVPVAWCKSGGSETYRRRAVNTKKHNEIHHRMKTIRDAEHEASKIAREEKFEALRKINTLEERIHQQGAIGHQTYTLALLRKQKARKLAQLTVAAGKSGSHVKPMHGELGQWMGDMAEEEPRHFTEKELMQEDDLEGLLD
jgi:hypothetical protein